MAVVIGEVILQAVKETELLRKVAVDSAWHHGIWPLDPSVVLKWVAKENPEQVEKDEGVLAVACEYCKHELLRMEHLMAEIQWSREKEKKKRKSGGLDLSMAKELTAPGQLALNALDQALAEFRTLKVEALHEWMMKELKFERQQLVTAAGHWCPMPELLAMVEKLHKDQAGGGIG